MGTSGFRQSRWGSRLLLLGLLLLVLSPFGFVAARSFVDLDSPSPALGRSQVITQGIAELPDDNYVMRIVRRVAPALGDAKVGRRALGFALATDEPILITEVEGEDDFTDLARLAPGEAFMTTSDEVRQIRASLSGQSAEYIGIEFVRPDQVNDVGTGELLYSSDVLSTPSGQRDLDLVRNVLAQDDVAEVPDTGGQVLVVATDGAIDILPARRPPFRLEAGESAYFEAEGLEIRPAENSAYGVPSNQLASLTNMLQTDSPVAGYVVVVVGPEVPKTGEPTPTATVPPVPTSTPEATVEATTAPQPVGVLGLTGRLCAPGVTVETISERACPIQPSGFDMALSGNGVDRSLGDASQIDASWYWVELPLGAHALVASAFPANANDYFIPGSAVVGGSSATGYTVTLDQSAPNLLLTVFFLQPQPQPTSAPVTFTIQACQQGMVNCGSPSSYNIDPQPYLIGPNGEILTAADAQRSGDAYTWTIPAGTWSFYQQGWQSYYYVDGAIVNGGAPYVFVTDGANAQRHLVQDEIVVLE